MILGIDASTYFEEMNANAKYYVNGKECLKSIRYLFMLSETRQREKDKYYIMSLIHEI